LEKSNGESLFMTHYTLQAINPKKSFDSSKNEIGGLK